MHSYCLQLASPWFKSSCNFATMLLLLDGNLKTLLCFIMMCRIEVHCEAHCAMCIMQSQWLLVRGLKLQVNLVQCCYYSTRCNTNDFRQVLFFDSSTFKLHQCFLSWINHDYKSNVIVNGMEVCQLCQSYVLQLFWRVSILDLSFKFFFATT